MNIGLYRTNYSIVTILLYSFKLLIYSYRYVIKQSIIDFWIFSSLNFELINLLIASILLIGVLN